MSRTATTQEEVRDELETYLRDKGISNLFIHIMYHLLSIINDWINQWVNDWINDFIIESQSQSV